MSPLTRKLTNIQLSLIHVNPLSDVPILDTLMSFAYVRRHASFPLASHLAVSSNAVRVGYTVVRFNRVRIELTFYHYSLKRTHNLGLGGGPNFRWQYRLLLIQHKGFTDDHSSPIFVYKQLRIVARRIPTHHRFLSLKQQKSSAEPLQHRPLQMLPELEV